MIALKNIRGLPPLARLLYLVGHMAPEGRLTGFLTHKTLAQWTGLDPTQLSQTLATLSPDMALDLAPWNMAYFRERSKTECTTYKQWLGAVNKLQNIPRPLQALWLHDNHEAIAQLSPQGQKTVHERLRALGFPEEYNPIAQEIIRGARMPREDTLALTRAYDTPPGPPEPKYTPINNPQKGNLKEHLASIPPELRERLSRVPQYGRDYIAGRGIPYPQEVKELARELWEHTTLTQGQITSLLSLPSDTTISNWRHLEAWPTKHPGARRQGRDWQALRAQALELRAQGLTLVAIARQLDIGLGTAGRWLRGTGIRPVRMPRGDTLKPAGINTPPSQEDTPINRARKGSDTLPDLERTLQNFPTKEVQRTLQSLPIEKETQALLGELNGEVHLEP